MWLFCMTELMYNWSDSVLALLDQWFSAHYIKFTTNSVLNQYHCLEKQVSM